MRSSCRFPQAAITAWPTLATVCEPPGGGPGGRRVSASRQLTFDDGRSAPAAANWPRIVVPVPRSWLATSISAGHRRSKTSTSEERPAPDMALDAVADQPAPLAPACRNLRPVLPAESLAPRHSIHAGFDDQGWQLLVRGSRWHSSAAEARSDRRRWRLPVHPSPIPARTGRASPGPRIGVGVPVFMRARSRPV